ncbi:hypothetical protein PF004_g29502 [Phytophthora fragariae]|uniref:Uncharacterized protein n=1 Tax=Phytophthora fragariae TaxID=53985 RepID=A0A6G0MEN2_9STRA|nr:hypothetical protein PF003_g32061 [Phytophthora fragariae]KAE9165428.1 hypothetical protein PF004_g29502 [Phytophthora fragariae]
MTTDTRIIVRPAPDALRAVGPIKTHADAPTPSDMEEKPPAPASKKHSGDPEEAKDASASKKPANDKEEAKETPASKKHAKDAGEAKKPASKKPKVATAKAKAKKTPASPKATRKAKKLTVSSKPAPKKPVVKKPAAKQLPKTKGASKEGPKTLKLPPKRTDVMLPGPHEDVSSDSSDTDTPNPGYVSGVNSPAPRARTSTKDDAASAKDAPTSPPGRSPSPHPSLEVENEESEPDVDHADGEVVWSPKRITDAQRVLHPGSPMSPKTVVAVERARLLEESLSRRDDPPAAVSEPQVITNAGVDEGVPPELLQPENRQHLADRTHQEASQAVSGIARSTPTYPRPATRTAILDSGRVPRTPSSESHAWPRRAAVRQVSGRAPGGHRFLPPKE